MRRLALALLLVGSVAVAQPTKAPTKVEPTKAVVTKTAPATKAVPAPVTKAEPAKAPAVTKAAPVPVTKVIATKAVTKVVVEVKAAPQPASKPVVVEAKVVGKAPASQPASAPASQKAAVVPKDAKEAESTVQQIIYSLQHKDWRHASALFLMLLIYFWRRYGEKLLALHKVPDRYMGFVTVAVSIVYTLALALVAKGKFDWTAFLTNAAITGGESFLYWEVAGKFLLEKTLGETPAKKRRKAACAKQPEAPKVEEKKAEEDKSA